MSKACIEAASLFCAALILFGCRGGGGSSSGVVPLGLVSKSGSGTASFSVVVPSVAKSRTSPESLVVTVAAVNGQAPSLPVPPAKMNLMPTTSGCRASIGGQLNCTATIAVPAGSDTFVIATYSQPNGTGTLLSSSQTTTSISANRTSLCTQTNRGTSAPPPALQTIIHGTKPGLSK